MRIGLLGFGVVGRGVYDITSARSDMQVAKVVCLEDISLPDAQVTKNFQDVLTDSTIDTVVEAMGGLHPAYEFVRAAIEAGKNVVTSTKRWLPPSTMSFFPLRRARACSSAAPLPSAAVSAGSPSWSGHAVSSPSTVWAAL